MDIKSTAGERLKTYLEGLSEKQRRGILLADTLRRLPDPLKGQVTSIYRTIKQPQQNGKQEE